MGVTRSQLPEEPLSLAIEEKYDQVRTLITMGKERGYLLYDEVNDILPAEVHSSERDRGSALDVRAIRHCYLRRCFGGEGCARRARNR